MLRLYLWSLALFNYCDSPNEELKFEIIKIEGQHSKKQKEKKKTPNHTNALQSRWYNVRFPFISVRKFAAIIETLEHCRRIQRNI